MSVPRCVAWRCLVNGLALAGLFAVVAGCGDDGDGRGGDVTGDAHTSPGLDAAADPGVYPRRDAGTDVRADARADARAGRGTDSGADASGGANGNGTGGANGAGTGGGAAGTGGEQDAGENPDAAPGEEQFDTVYDVGPGQSYADPSEVPWESQSPGTLVRIHYRSEPYATKWVINTTGTQDKPVVIRGVPEEGGGALPVITGQDAVTRAELSYWNEVRSAIKVGGSNLPTDEEVPAHVRIENLEIRSARPPYQFTDDSGDRQTYAENAAAIHVEIGDHITIAGCILRDSGNGFFAGHQTSNLLLEGNHIYDNGIEGSGYHHNNYTESFGITFQYNRFGPLRDGCLGNNLKDRSAGTIIRYNWIESGNRQLDLVDSDYREFVDDSSYDETFVYGNVLIEPDGAGNSQVVHYGGDGDDESLYRKGTLYFYNNTVVSTRSGNTTLIRLSTNDVTADIRNNIIYTSAGGGNLAVCNGTGIVDLTANWLSAGWRQTHESSVQGAFTVGDNLEGAEPGFEDAATGDYALALGSPCSGAAGDLASRVLPAHDVTRQYVRHQSSDSRPDRQALSIGALGP